MIKKILQSLRKQSEGAREKYECERVRYQCNGDSDTALMLLEHIICETDYGQKLKKSVAAKPEYMQALIAFAKESNRPVNDPQVAALLERDASTTPQYFVCSACQEAFTFDELHVLPWWNADVATFFTTYRCNKCLPQSVLETLTKRTNPDGDVKGKFIGFLRFHKQEKLAEAYSHAEGVTANTIANDFLNDVEQYPLVLFVRVEDKADFFLPHS